MSLSKNPETKITSITPQNISDEILGGTISFCEETGYKQNIIMLTFLWAGFLHSLKNQIDEYGLVKNILNCYTRSLGKLFSKITDDVSLKKEVAEMLHHYWNQLNQDFYNLKNEDEISAFFQIANKLNSEDDISSAYLLNKTPIKPFIKISNNISSSVYCILHQIDNEIGIQYRGIVQYNIPYKQTDAKKTSSKIKPTYIQNKTKQMQSTDDTVPWGKILIVGLIIALLFMIALVSITNNTSSTASNQPPPLTAVTEPKSGEILLGQEDLYGSELTITASGGSACVVKLKTSSGTTRLSFYVRAGDTVTIGVPAEYLYIYFASGDTWYGEKNLFGSQTNYSMDDKLLDFTQYTWEYTLSPVTNGNFSETPINPEDF